MKKAFSVADKRHGFRFYRQHPQHCMPETTLILGHKNPDADAVCSAIAYAAFKQDSGAKGSFIPARCGNSNVRIDVILKHFDVPLPRFVGDVTPRLRDVMRREVLKVHESATCGEALELIDVHDVRALPVVDPEDRFKGLVSIFSLGEFFIPKIDDPRRMRHVHTSIGDIVRLLDAQIHNLREGDRVEDYYIRVGAMDIRSFGRFTEREGICPEESIIIVGDRYDIQQKAISAGARLIVVTGGLEMDADVIGAARERGVSVIVSRFDTATTSWLIRTSTKVAPMIDADSPTFSPNDKLQLVQRKVARTYAPLYCVTDQDKRLLGVFSKTDLLRGDARKLILVDHNELSQAVTGASECDIVEVIDHHRLGNPPSAQPIFFRNDVIGSTCSIVASLYQERGLRPSPAIAGVMMGGLISDTLNLQGPTTTQRDRELLLWLSDIAQADPDAIADLIFKSGSLILSSEPLEVIQTDCKHYEQGDWAYSVSQIEELGFSNFWDHAEQLIDALESYRSKEKLAFSTLLVTDINRQNSLLVYKGPQGLREAINYPSINGQTIFDMPGIVSRKKQLIPYVTTLLNAQ